MRVRSGIALLGVTALAFSLVACAPPAAPGGESPAAPPAESPAGVPDKPSAPVTLNILDVAGNLKLTKPMIESYVADHPDIISSVTFETGGAPDVIGLVKPQVDTGNLSIDLVLTGNDGLSSGIGQGLWIQVVNEFGDRISNQANYLDQAAKMQELADGYGVVVTYYPSGPLLQYDPAVVTDVPSTPEELLAWAKAHPNKFGYARPANSGPGRTFLMGLPYILGDSDPADPENGWEKTWAYLKDLGQYIDNYPTGTGQVITNMGDGTWAMIPTTTGWEIEPRTDGRLPNTLEAAHFDTFTWVTDAHYAAIPKGQSPDKISAILLLLQDMLTPEQNAKAY
ncbi:MAG: extracellular solute-binding protein, partial [Propionibacteriaceae bacterium]|nr:extracellular solute-binding protein [Propionibacteriaceae bacterium]